MKALFYGKKNTIDTKSGARYIHIGHINTPPKRKVYSYTNAFSSAKRKKKKINLRKRVSRAISLRPISSKLIAFVSDTVSGKPIDVQTH
jgi:hypothetical protein